MTQGAGQEPAVFADASTTRAPLVSVCVPLYMKERFVRRTVRSVLSQTFSDFELVVLHNASPDRSAEIVSSFDDPRIRLLHNEETISGPENAASVARLARGQLMKILAADDVLHPTVLERQVAVLTDPRIAVVSCRQDMIDEHDAVIYPDRSLRTSDLIGRQDRRTVLRRVIRHSGNPVGAYANLMFRRADYEAIGGMPRHVPWIAHDLALVLALLECGDFYGIDETLVDFRIAAGSSSARESSAGVAEQVAYIERLRREEHALLRPRDILYSRMRMPLMQLRHRMIVAAAGPHISLRTKLARRLLGLTGSTVGIARISKSSRSRRPTP